MPPYPAAAWHRVVCQPRRAGDDILLCKHAVQQLQRQTGGFVLHSDDQGLGIVFLCMGTGQTGQLIFARLHRVAHIGKVCAKGTTLSATVRQDRRKSPTLQPVYSCGSRSGEMPRWVR